MSDSELYHVEAVDINNKNDWNLLANTAKQHSIFMRDDYLNVLGYSSDKYLVYKKNKVCAGLCIPIDKKNLLPVKIVPYAPYQGLLYSSSEDNYSDYRTNLEATEFLLDYLYESKKYKSIAFSNSIYVKDVRAIQWHHYHEPNLGMYEIGIRYTAILDFNGAANIEQRINDVRTRDYKKSKEKYELNVVKSLDRSEFTKLYYKTFERQGITISKESIKLVNGLVDLLLESGEGELTYAVDQAGNYIDAVFIVYDNNYAYYLFGANDPSYRKLGGGTLLFMEAMKRMPQRGIKCFDFIGCNSPYRADFKLSFGGRIEPYYICNVDYNK